MKKQTFEHFKQFLSVFVFTFIIGFSPLMTFSQTILLQESFETDGQNSRYYSNQYSNLGSCDYWFRSPAPLGTCNEAFTGWDNNYYWAAEDVPSAANGNQPGVLTLAPLNVSYYSDLNISMLIGANSTGSGWELSDVFRVEVAMDNGAWETIGAFYGDLLDPGVMRQDIDLDGMPDSHGAGLSLAMQNFTYHLPTTATTIQVRLFLDNDGSEELVFDNIIIRGTPTCATPSDLTTGNITSNTAELSWTENGLATTWELRLGETGFDTTGIAPMNVTSNPYTAMNLLSGAVYDFYVRSDCGGGLYSDWAGPHSFAVPACDISATTLPYFMGFETQNGMAIGNGTVCGPAFYWSFETDHPGKGRASYGTYAYSTASGVGAATLDRNPVGANTINYLILTLDLSNYSANTDLELTYSYADHADETGANDKVWLRGSMLDEWVEVTDLDPSNTTDDIFQTVTAIDIDDILANASPSQEVSSTFQVRFGQEGTDRAGTDGITFDDILIRQTPCPAPSDLFAENITGTSVDLGWTENSTSTAWEVVVGIPDFDPAITTPIDVPTNPFIKTGLAANTDYEFYVRAVCGSGATSEWSGPQAFTTAPCDLPAYTLPYFEGFELISGSSQNDGVSCFSAFSWEYQTSHQGIGRIRYGTNAFQMNNGLGALTLDRSFYDGTNTNNYLILTLNLSAYSSSSDLELAFSYADHNDESNPNDKVWVRGSTDENWVEIYNLDPDFLPDHIYVDVSGLDIDATLSGAVPPQTVSATFQLRFGQYDNFPAGDGDGISFDDIRIEEALNKTAEFNNVDNDGNSDIQIYTHKQTLTIRSEGEQAETAKEVWVYDLFGRTILHAILQPSTFDQLKIDAKGYLVVKVISGNTVATEKVMVR